MEEDGNDGDEDGDESNEIISIFHANDERFPENERIFPDESNQLQMFLPHADSLCGDFSRYISGNFFDAPASETYNPALFH